MKFCYFGWNTVPLNIEDSTIKKRVYMEQSLANDRNRYDVGMIKINITPS